MCLYMYMTSSINVYWFAFIRTPLFFTIVWLINFIIVIHIICATLSINTELRWRYAQLIYRRLYICVRLVTDREYNSSTGAFIFVLDLVFTLVRVPCWRSTLNMCCTFHSHRSWHLFFIYTVSVITVSITETLLTIALVMHLHNGDTINHIIGGTPP